MTSLQIKGPLQGVGWCFSLGVVGEKLEDMYVDGWWGVSLLFFFWFKLFVITELAGYASPSVSLIVLGWVSPTNFYISTAILSRANSDMPLATPILQFFGKFRLWTLWIKPHSICTFLTEGRVSIPGSGMPHSLQNSIQKLIARQWLLCFSFSTPAVWNFSDPLIQSMNKLGPLVE